MDPQEGKPDIPSFGDVKMYIKPASTTSYYAHQPAMPDPTRKNGYAQSIRLPRSESFESLLELSVLASEILEEGEVDLEQDSTPTGKQQTSVRRSPNPASTTPPNHQTPTFPDTYTDSPALSSVNDRTHARNDSSWTVASSSGQSTSQKTYSTQPSDLGEEQETLMIEKEDVRSIATFGHGTDQRSFQGRSEIENATGPASPYMGTENGSSLMQRGLSSSTQTPGLYAEHAFFGDAWRDSPSFSDSLYAHSGHGVSERSAPAASIGARTASTSITESQVFHTPLHTPFESDSNIQSATTILDGESHQSTYAVASTSSPVRAAPNPFGSPAPPGMKISQWLKQQYDSGVRAPVSPPRAAHPSSASHGQSVPVDIAVAQARGPSPSAPFGSLLKMPGSPGAQHREQLLTQIIANDFASGQEGARQADAPSTAELEQLPWHPNEHVSPVRRGDGLRRSNSTGSANLLGSMGIADSIRNSRLRFDQPTDQPRDPSSTRRLSGSRRLSQIEFGSLSPRPSTSEHRRSTSDTGLSRFGLGSLRGAASRVGTPAMSGSAGLKKKNGQTDLESDRPAPGMFAYEEGGQGTPDVGASLQSWQRMRSRGRASMNDLLLSRGEDRSSGAGTPSGSQRGTISQAIPPSPAEATYSYEATPLRQHKRSISSMASSLFSRPSLSSPSIARWSPARSRNQSAGASTSQASPVLSGTTRSNGTSENRVSVHARTVSEPFPISPIQRVRVPLFPSTANSSSSSLNEVHGHSRPSSPLSRANHAAYLEGSKFRTMEGNGQDTPALSPPLSRHHSLGDRGAGYFNEATASPVRSPSQKGPKLSDLASQQVARDAELRSKLVSKFKPSPPPVPEELADEAIALDVVASRSRA